MYNYGRNSIGASACKEKNKLPQGVFTCPNFDGKEEILTIFLDYLVNNENTSYLFFLENILVWRQSVF